MTFLRTAKLDRKCRYCDKIMPFRARVCPDCKAEKCRSCKGKAVPGTRFCEACSERSNALFRDRYQSDAEFREKAKAAAIRSHWKAPEARRAKMRETARARHLKLKLEALRRYGDRCVCCGESRYQFLTFDHSLKDGFEHREKLLGDGRLGGGPFLKALAKQGWPEIPGLRTLCSNCHLAIDLWGKCPHEEELKDV